MLKKTFVFKLAFKGSNYSKKSIHNPYLNCGFLVLESMEL